MVAEFIWLFFLIWLRQYVPYLRSPTLSFTDDRTMIVVLRMGPFILLIIGLLVKFQDGHGAMISTGVAQSVCGQVQEFSRTQTVQLAQKAKPTPAPSIPCGWFKFTKCPVGKFN